uniref:Glutamate receptor 1 n=1 Tax=Ascaris suum TaxID=6253 RepID=F1KT32_ASCSU
MAIKAIAIAIHVYFYLPLILAYPAKIPIRSYTFPEDNDQGVVASLRYSERLHNNNRRNPFKLELKNRELQSTEADTWSVLNTVCDELREGMMVIMCGDGARAHEAYLGVAENLEVPLINWDLAPIIPADGSFNKYDFEVSIRPPTAELIADFILYKQWTEIVYMHDGKNSATALQWIYYYLHKKSNISVNTEMVRIPRDSEEFPEFLRRFHANRMMNDSSKRVVLDASSSFRQQQMLAAIRSAQFNQMQYHYVVANFDFLPHDVELFENGNINISGFQIINREIKEYWNLKKYLANVTSRHEVNRMQMEARAAFVHDAVIVAKAGLEATLRRNDSLFRQNFRHGNLYNRGYPGIYCHPNLDFYNPHRPFTTFEHGQAIARAFRGLKLDTVDGTLTGRIEFDRFGLRKNFDVTVIDLVSNTKSAFNRKEMMIWKQGVGFFANRTIAQHTRKHLESSERHKIVKVVTVITEPFVMLKRGCESSNRTECQGNERFEGFCIDLLKLLSDRIEDFHYEIILSNKYGAKQPDGSWDGLIGALLSGEADVCVASLTINQDRERVVDFSKPYMTTGISIMIKKPDKQEFSVFSFMQPLSTEIWMYIIFAYVGVSVVIFLVSRFSPYEWRVEEMPNGNGFTISNDFSVYNCLWFTLAAFMQQGTDILPRSISGRIASSAWWFFTMIIVSSYTANLAAFLTLEKMQAPIESVEDLAKQTKIKYGIQQGGSTAQFFKYSSVQIYQRMWRYMESQVPTVFTSSYAEGIERVRNHKGRYAFLLEATANEYANTRKPCDTMKVGANLNSVGYGVATPFGSPYKDQINLAILALQERGEMKKLENKWWYDRGQCDQGITVDGHNASLNLSKVAGIFYILMGGMIASMIAALGEFLYRSRIEARKGNVGSLVGCLAKGLRASMFAQLRLSLQGGAVAEQGTPAYDILKRQKASSLLPSSKGVDKMSKNHDDSTTTGIIPRKYNTAV